MDKEVEDYIKDIPDDTILIEVQGGMVSMFTMIPMDICYLIGIVLEKKTLWNFIKKF